MGQFVDYKFWPSRFQCEAIKLFEKKGCIFGVFEMQLSLMHDILYTKTAVSHTWCGCCIRAFSLLATGAALALFLLQFSSAGARYDHDKTDVVVTYILLVGAFLLEIASTLRNIGSTWTCALLRFKGADQLHSKLVSLRRFVKAAESRAWSGSIGQHVVMGISGPDFSINKGWKWETARLWNRLLYSSFFSSSTVISTGAKELVLKEISRMVEACEGKKDIMEGYRGQCALKLLFEDPTRWINGMDFDKSILVWHYATVFFISKSRRAEKDNNARPIVEAINALSSYMMFLFLERPYMLPSPVRVESYITAVDITAVEAVEDTAPHSERDDLLVDGADSASILGHRLAQKLTRVRESADVWKGVLGVWVEMLCYAAHYCSRESHVRQLADGGELITIVWFLTSAVFNHCYCDEDWFKERASQFFASPPHGKSNGFFRPHLG